MNQYSTSRSRGRSGSEDKHSTAEGRRNSLNRRVSYSKELEKSPLRKRAGGKDIKRIKEAKKARQHQAGNERKEQERRRERGGGRKGRKRASSRRKTRSNRKKERKDELLIK